MKTSSQPTNFAELAVIINNSFDAQQKYLDKRFAEQRTEFRHDIDELRKDITGLKQDVSVLKQDVGMLQRDVRSLDRRTDMLVTDVGHIKKVIKRLPTQKNLTNLKKRVYALEHTR